MIMKEQISWVWVVTEEEWTTEQYFKTNVEFIWPIAINITIYHGNWCLCLSFAYIQIVDRQNTQIITIHIL